MRTPPLLITAIFIMLTLHTWLEAQEVFGYELTTDVVYGEGKVVQDGKEVVRELMMDV